MEMLLKGVRILDLTRLLPGPYMTMLLADLGAEVVKIETPRIGDYARMAPANMGLGGLFEAVNRNKKSLGINYRNPRGREIFLQLAEEADVVVEGFRPGAVQRWKIDYQAIRAVNPRVVYCSLSGYGQDGPYRDKAGHDLNYLAVGGILGLNGEPGGRPIPPGVPIADLSGGMLAAIAILAALVGRGNSGTGTYLDVSMLDAVVSWAGTLAGGQYFSTGRSPERGTMPLSGGLGCFNVYRTLDKKYLSLGALEPHFWADFCKTVGRDDLLSRQFAPDLKADLEALFMQRTRAEWLRLFEGKDACLEPVNQFDEMLAHPQLRHRGLVQTQAGKPTGIASPFVFAGREKVLPPPELGEHTREILTSLGISKKEIDELAAKKVIALG